MQRPRTIDRILFNIWIALILVSGWFSIIAATSFFTNEVNEKLIKIELTISAICATGFISLLIIHFIMDIVQTKKMERIMKQNRYRQPSNEDMARFFEALAKDCREKNEKNQDNG